MKKPDDNRPVVLISYHAVNYCHWDYFCIFLWLYVNKLILNALIIYYIRTSGKVQAETWSYFILIFFFNILLSDLIQFVKDNHL